jgi:two-component system, LytTR family, sensor kinase
MSLFSGKKITIYLHIAGWMFIFFLPFFLSSNEGRENFSFGGRTFIRTAIYIILFYSSYLWLIPKFFLQNKKLKYYISVFIVITVMYFVNGLANHLITPYMMERRRPEPRNLAREFRPPNDFWKWDVYNYFFTSVLISGFSLGLRMSANYVENEKKRKELEKEKLSSELAFLKNQVSPHFFFNTLNNIYSLTEINTKEAQKAILQLSKLMRYLLYESEKGDVKLSSEIAFMKNYVELMKLRVSEKVKLSFSFPETYKDIFFPPLLFIPFIENAFKHGVSYKDNSFVKMELRFEGHNLIFSSINSVSSKTEDLSGSGIGLDNARKRLSLLFPNNHKLSITQNEEVFDISLVISDVV